MAKTPRVVVDEHLEPGAPFLHGEDLVDLLLILEDREPHLGVLDHVLHLIGNGVLIERNRHAAQRLRREHRPIEARAVVANDGDLVAAFKAETGQTARERPHFFGDFPPDPRLPDAVILFADGDPIGPLLHEIEQHFGKGVEALQRVTNFRRHDVTTLKLCDMAVGRCDGVLFGSRSPERTSSGIESPPQVLRGPNGLEPSVLPLSSSEH